MVHGEVITYDEAVTLWSLLNRIAGETEVVAMLWKNSEEDHHEIVMERLISLRQKITPLVVTPGEEDTGLLVVRLPAHEKTGSE